ncbi:MAG: TIGR01440 family protein [Candidatus Competibacteraceae bacterium]|nr:TIGR01440 family protein [Candidatus Competibacteraceae bacterium]
MLDVMSSIPLITQQVQTVVAEVAELSGLTDNQLLVIGCSTSEIMGKSIGKGGSEAIAAAVYQGIDAAQQRYGFDVAFQCCEHLNRALVVKRATQRRFALEEVTVVPTSQAGGAMAAFVYKQWCEPMVVETIVADAGIDIGDTLIGMHLRRVAVPIRPSVRTVGEAHVTAAKTRPKLIGGVRAVYHLDRNDAVGREA